MERHDSCCQDNYRWIVKRPTNCVSFRGRRTYLYLRSGFSRSKVQQALAYETFHLLILILSFHKMPVFPWRLFIVHFIWKYNVQLALLTPRSWWQAERSLWVNWPYCQIFHIRTSYSSWELWQSSARWSWSRNTFQKLDSFDSMLLNSKFCASWTRRIRFEVYQQVGFFSYNIHLLCLPREIYMI